MALGRQEKFLPLADQSTVLNVQEDFGRGVSSREGIRRFEDFARFGASKGGVERSRLDHCADQSVSAAVQHNVLIGGADGFQCARLPMPMAGQLSPRPHERSVRPSDCSTPRYHRWDQRHRAGGSDEAGRIHRSAGSQTEQGRSYPTKSHA
ncbi:hypothetical protein E5E91_09140 [Deinococcus radiodurans R1 = ATCC 13939 = DSM 20539]|uniref:Uncharacterized protein n=1 Tax=Deinococcus radiodurans (strain ATCC 13939 / DSM 20539 / JCM 16871 / CCUG 27074 / LMG 4051 / NBRC 15346 / NCIMB 9279 / VKM B-1422 / R1) TaxID=243230 RepID=Q9RTJ0_DEIRA|nr:hypothetical protein DR_1774 [Deinococcus radiodurans R1 = ATCC 13939 = DSM 20539]QEM72780.1 hypothetical protein DXG80_05055 [Deinococcus radiodurans]UDL01725.1 hypothetical protein E5E91_09140 [Deinococcus radiodurans R1 = ATCC 13939 = DSM 20539]HCE65217.1 hypothetical protein [Deinococcus radiodurans]